MATSNLIVIPALTTDQAHRLAGGDDENPFSSIKGAIVMTPHDWSAHHRLAWIYGIAVGWDEEALVEVAKVHNWSDATIGRLRRLRERYLNASRQTEDHPQGFGQ